MSSCSRFLYINVVDIRKILCCLLLMMMISVFVAYGITKMDIDYGDQLGDEATWVASKGNVADHNTIADGYQNEEAEPFKINDNIVGIKPQPDHLPDRITVRSLLALSPDEADDDDNDSEEAIDDRVSNCEKDDDDTSWFIPENSFSPCQVTTQQQILDCGKVCMKHELTIGRCLNDQCQCCTMSNSNGWFFSRAYLRPCREDRLTDTTACSMGCYRQGAAVGTCVSNNCICSMEEL